MVRDAARKARLLTMRPVGFRVCNTVVLRLFRPDLRRTNELRDPDVSLPDILAIHPLELSFRKRMRARARHQGLGPSFEPRKFLDMAERPDPVEVIIALQE